MRGALVILLFGAAPCQAVAVDRDPAALTPYQAEALKVVGVAPPPADALATAALLVDRSLQADEAKKPVADQIFESWTRNLFVSKDYGMPCDVAVAKCTTSARAASRELAPLVMSKVRDLGVLLFALQLSGRFSEPELATVKAFVGTPAGAKIAPEAFTGGPQVPDPRWENAGDDIKALNDKYRRRFIEETRSLPRAKPPEPPRPPKATP